jgi:tungstate transport system ATP-binding protein
MSPVLFEVDHLVKRYDGRTVLDLEGLMLEQGKVIALIGPNGAGKTTLLEILALLLQPDEGEFRYNRERVDFSSSRLHRLRKKIVLVQQQPILFTTTVCRNVEYPLKIRGRQRHERKKIVEDLISLVGMEAFANAKAHRLSGGETQRIAMAQALACYPEVILLDEPTASVDVENQVSIERIIRKMNRDKGLSIIFTTHDIQRSYRTRPGRA